MKSQRMRNLLKQNQKMLVGYLLAGYPDEEAFLNTIKWCEGKIDILEIGFPSENPYADGEVIRQAHKAVKREKVCKTEYWQRVRQTVGCPIWIMAYYADFIETGLYRQFAKEGLMDALVIPDAIPEQLSALKQEMLEYKLDVVGFLNPDMNEKEMGENLAKYDLVYEQLYVGKTGETNHNAEQYLPMLEYSKTFPAVCKFGGFGVSSGTKAQKILKDGFDGVIVGTELIRKLNESTEAFRSFIAEMHQAVMV